MAVAVGSGVDEPNMFDPVQAASVAEPATTVIPNHAGRRKRLMAAPLCDPLRGRDFAGPKRKKQVAYTKGGGQATRAATRSLRPKNVHEGSLTRFCRVRRPPPRAPRQNRGRTFNAPLRHRCDRLGDGSGRHPATSDLVATSGPRMIVVRASFVPRPIRPTTLAPQARMIKMRAKNFAIFSSHPG
jgi:hypothetical protein